MGRINYLPTERVLKAWRELTVFLQEFIENNFGKAGLRRIVREPTYFEKHFNGARNLAALDQPSVFFTDRDFYYTRVMFLGRELDLLLLNVLVYSLVDLLLESTIISVFVCYLVEVFVCALRQLWGQRTISRKTLIDGRFLI